MRFTDIIKFSVLNTVRGRIRTVLTVLAVAIGAASTLFITTSGETAKTAVYEELNRTGISGITIFPQKNAVDQGVNITGDDAVAVSTTLKNVDIAMPVMIKYTSYKMKDYQGNLLIYGIDEHLSESLSLELLYGRFPDKYDVLEKRDVAVIDSDFAAMVYERDNIVGKYITVNIGGKYHELEIIGIIASQSVGISQIMGNVLPYFLYMPYTSYQKYSGDKYIDQIIINSDDMNLAESAAEYLNARFNTKNGFKYESISDIRSQIDNTVTIISIFVSSIAAISLVVAGLGIMNTMLSTTTERKREIGLYMAIGASQGDIIKCFLAEALMLSAIGGAIGISVSLIAMKILGNNLQLYFAVNPLVVLFLELFSLFCGLVFGIIPAINASKMLPVDALKTD